MRTCLFYIKLRITFLIALYLVINSSIKCPVQCPSSRIFLFLDRRGKLSRRFIRYTAVVLSLLSFLRLAKSIDYDFLLHCLNLYLFRCVICIYSFIYMYINKGIYIYIYICKRLYFMYIKKLIKMKLCKNVVYKI